MELWLDTLRALAEPRRAVPIALVALPLLAAQVAFGINTWEPFLTGLMTVVLFLALMPALWRRLFPNNLSPIRNPGGLVIYAAVGAVPATLGGWLPEMIGHPEAFLATGANTAVVAGLSLVGGWGLARDIDLEQGMLRAQKEAEHARLMAIRAHLDPHFLFNTLNAIAAWCAEDPVVAEKAILKLSALLRELLGGISAPLWPLRRELDVCRDVWELHRIRDPSWFTVRWEVDPQALDAMVPPMLLLPLVENAVKHGPAKGHRGELAMEVVKIGDRIEIRVGNPGGFAGPRAEGEGLKMVEARLESAYGAKARFEIGGDGPTVAVVAIPGQAG